MHRVWADDLRICPYDLRKMCAQMLHDKFMPENMLFAHGTYHAVYALDLDLLKESPCLSRCLTAS